MADIKISALPTATTPLTGAELVPVVQGGVTKQTTATAIFTAGVLPVVNGGTGTATPALVPGSNVTITGTWPNQTINSTSSATVTSVSVVSANGLAGTVANPTTTPAITLSTSVTGVVKGNGTTLSAASAGTDYVAPGGALGTPSSGTVTNLTGTASININGTVGATTPNTGTFTSLNTGQLAGLRNKIINGNMNVSQRASVSLAATYQYGLADRFLIAISGGTGISGADYISTPNPELSSGKAYGTGAGNWTNGQFIVNQRIESLNSFGCNGKIITVSAKVYQNTGGARSFNVQLVRPTTTADNFSALTVLQTITASQSVPSGVFTTISVTFAALGTTDASLGLGLYIYDSAANTVVNKIYLVGDVQLEIGSVATPFEQRPYGMELALCQRYYYRLFPAATNKVLGSGMATSTTTFLSTINFPSPMRTPPTALEQSGTANQYTTAYGSSATVLSAVPAFVSSTDVLGHVSGSVAAGLTTGAFVQMRTDATNGASAYLGFSAEL